MTCSSASADGRGDAAGKEAGVVSMGSLRDQAGGYALLGKAAREIGGREAPVAENARP